MRKRNNNTLSLISNSLCSNEINLSNAKDLVELDKKTNVVYKIPCKDCIANTYIKVLIL